MRHEDDPDAWPAVTVLSHPNKEDMVAHLKEVHGEVWNAITQDLGEEELE
jgi:hypothetical protein